MLRLNWHPSGRHFLQIPGPTNVPDRDPAGDGLSDDRPSRAGVPGDGVKVLRERAHRSSRPSSRSSIYPASGTGAWEAALVNTLSPGDAVLMFETGHFASLWKKMRREARHRSPSSSAATGGVAPMPRGASRQRLREDTGQAIKAVCVVHNETSTGVTSRHRRGAARDRCGEAPGAADGRHDLLAGFDRLSP